MAAARSTVTMGCKRATQRAPQILINGTETRARVNIAGAGQIIGCTWQSRGQGLDQDNAERTGALWKDHQIGRPVRLRQRRSCQGTANDGHFRVAALHDHFGLSATNGQPRRRFQVTRHRRR